MNVREWMERFSEEFMTEPVLGVVVIAVADKGPLLVSTMEPETARTLMDICVNIGDWSKIREIKPN